MTLDSTQCYAAALSRDRRFDGRFFAGVVTTGVYCRPICPARPPKPENVCWFARAAAAEAAGFRPCRRCRPEVSGGSSALLARALRLIAAGDGGSTDALADRLGIGVGRLQRLFATHVGASPAALRRARETGAGLGLRLPYRPPLDWPGLLAFLATRATPGVEAVADGVYRRTITLGATTGTIEVRAVADRPHLLMRVSLAPDERLLQMVARARRLFDLEADPTTIGAHLARIPELAPHVARRPGLRVPGAWDGFELAVRAVLGQQVTVRGATTLAGRLVRAFGTPLDAGNGLTHLFPRPEALVDADVGSIGIPRARARTIRALARAVACGDLVLDVPRGLDQTIERLMAVPGIGSWTANYIAMRACGEPDALPAGDLGLRRALGNGRGPIAAARVAERAEAWRPWRAYATLHLWEAQ